MFLQISRDDGHYPRRSAGQRKAHNSERMQLSLGDSGAMATLGPQLKLKKNVFQGVVVQVRDIEMVPELLRQVRALPRLRKSQHMPVAMRVRSASMLHPSVLLQALQAQEENPQSNPNKKKPYRPTEDPAVTEDWEDDGECGVGDRLLHILQRWQVQNVILIVARQDDSLSGRLIGQELFKLMAETAKLALEQYYLSHMKPSDAAKLEIYDDARGAAQYIVSPRGDPQDQQAQQLRASVCLMDSETIQSWPQNHHATSDGGGRHATKKGRVKHFNHGRKTTIAPPQVQGPSNNESPTGSNGLDQPENTQQPLVACEGIDWLGISRDEWLKLRAIRVPVKELHYLFMCLVVLVDHPIEKQSNATSPSRQDPAFPTPSYSWSHCREIVQHTTHWGPKLKAFHGSAMAKSQALALRSVVQEPSVHETAFVRICSASVKLFMWMQRLLDEYDENELGMAPAPVPVSSPSPNQQQLIPQPPPPHKPHHHHHSLASGGTEEESALVRELNALAHHHAKKNQIVDRGRLLSN